MSASCPGCGHELVESTWESHYGRTVTIDECHACNGLWFDQREASLFTPRALLQLFRAVQGRQAGAREAALPEKACPRCRAPLKETWDQVRGTSFTYFACPAGCGRFSSFAQFLREKQLARDATAQELDALKARVKVVSCSSCGAPIDLHRTTVCSYCRAPVTFLESASLAQTLGQLAVPDAASLAARQSSSAEALQRTLAGLPKPERAGGADMVAVGLDALLKLLD